jgi:hypothetical protein
MIRRVVTVLLLTVTLSAMASSAGTDAPRVPAYVQLDAPGASDPGTSPSEVPRDCHGPGDCGYGDNGTNGDH